ncbi:MAG: exosortase-associated EpsI family protein [Verrucomicrobia bacterium]|nr:exosortase-associated EpsI family protein [Verrucomicrobiota bacterium]
MNRQKLIVFGTGLLLIIGTAVVLAQFKVHQKLGRPGVKTSPLAGSRNLRIDLPEKVPGYKSEPVETPEIVISILPKDTSYGQRRYLAEDGFQAVVNVVLMGSDRTSLHKPQYCVVGAGWTIDQTEMTTVPVSRPHPYDLPVIKLTTTKQAMINGQRVTARGIYVYWFVADQAISGDASGAKRMWSLATHLLRTGELQRWAYVTYFAVCAPGQEDATYHRLQQLMAVSVPEFQLVPRPTAMAEASSRPAGR